MKDFVCLECGAEFQSEQETACPECGSANTYELTQDCMAGDPRWEKAERERVAKEA